VEINKLIERHIGECHLESVFDVLPGTTVMEREVLQTEMVEDVPSYDEKDNEIDEQFQTVYDLAITAFADQAGVMNNDSDPKYAARGMEVANQFLTTALMAAKEKANLKNHKDKLNQNQGRQGAQVTNNNLIMTRGELFAMLTNKRN
jgi:hypothetical protein